MPSSDDRAAAVQGARPVEPPARRLAWAACCAWCSRRHPAVRQQHPGRQHKGAPAGSGCCAAADARVPHASTAAAAAPPPPKKKTRLRTQAAARGNHITTSGRPASLAPNPGTPPHTPGHPPTSARPAGPLALLSHTKPFAAPPGLPRGHAAQQSADIRLRRVGRRRGGGADLRNSAVVRGERARRGGGGGGARGAWAAARPRGGEAPRARRGARVDGRAAAAPIPTPPAARPPRPPLRPRG